MNLSAGIFTAAGFLFFAAFLPQSGISAKEEEKELRVVDNVDLDRYLGKWYEIAKYPAWFERDLVAITAEYSLKKNGKILVLNSGRYKTFDGKLKTAKGMAKIPDPKTPAKLKVSFFWPFYGNYWIIELDKEYGWVVIGEPSRKYLWILSRELKMDEATYSMLLDRISHHGYDISKIDKTQQP